MVQPTVIHLLSSIGHLWTRRRSEGIRAEPGQECGAGDEQIIILQFVLFGTG
jgi:hypothetical protein